MWLEFQVSFGLWSVEKDYTQFNYIALVNRQELLNFMVVKLVASN